MFVFRHLIFRDRAAFRIDKFLHGNCAGLGKLYSHGIPLQRYQ